MAVAEDLTVFENLSGEQIRAVASVFDGLHAMIRDNTGATLDDAGILSAGRVLYGLRSGADGADLRRAVRDSGLSAEKKSALLEAGEAQGRAGGQSTPLRSDSKHELRNLIELMNIDENMDIPDTLEGLMGDYPDGGEDSSAMIRSMRDRV